MDGWLPGSAASRGEGFAPARRHLRFGFGFSSKAQGPGRIGLWWNAWKTEIAPARLVGPAVFILALALRLQIEVREQLLLHNWQSRFWKTSKQRSTYHGVLSPVSLSLSLMEPELRMPLRLWCAMAS